jgi:hypothetical protein
MMPETSGFKELAYDEITTVCTKAALEKDEITIELDCSL